MWDWQNGTERGQRADNKTHPPLASGFTECVGHESQNQTWLTFPQQTLIMHLRNQPSSESWKEKQIFFSSNKLFNKPLIPHLFFPVGPLNIWFNIDWALRRSNCNFPSPPFKDSQSHDRCCLVIYFTAAKGRKSNVFIKKVRHSISISCRDRSGKH